MKDYFLYLPFLQNIHLSVRFFIWIRLTDGWLVVSFHNIFNPWVHIFKQKTRIYFWHVFLTETQLNANDCISTKIKLVYRLLQKLSSLKNRSRSKQKFEIWSENWSMSPKFSDLRPRSINQTKHQFTSITDHLIGSITWEELLCPWCHMEQNQCW